MPDDPEVLQGQTDEDLVASALGGGGEAYAVLVRRYTRLLYAICLGVLRDVHECEDAVQEVLVKGMTRLNELAEPERFSGWIAQVARNHCLDLVRKRSRRRELLRHHGELETAPADYDDLRAALWSLPAKHRVPLLLYYFDGQSTRSVAAMLDLSEGGASARLSRARTQLRELLTKKGGRS